MAAVVGLDEILREEGDAEAFSATHRFETGAAERESSARDPPRAQVHLFVDSAVALGTILRGSSRRGLGALTECAGGEEVCVCA